MLLRVVAAVGMWRGGGSHDLSAGSSSLIVSETTVATLAVTTTVINYNKAEQSLQVRSDWMKAFQQSVRRSPEAIKAIVAVEVRRSYIEDEAYADEMASSNGRDVSNTTSQGNEQRVWWLWLLSHDVKRSSFRGSTQKRAKQWAREYIIL